VHSKLMIILLCVGGETFASITSRPADRRSQITGFTAQQLFDVSAAANCSAHKRRSATGSDFRRRRYDVMTASPRQQMTS